MTVSTDTSPVPATRPSVNAIRAFLGNRRGLLVLGGAVLVLSLALKWNWLVAAGIAPLLLALAPCLAMCALGLCMNKMMGGSNKTQPPSSDAGSGPPTPLQLTASSGDPSETQAASGASVEPIHAADKSCCHR